MIMSHVSCEHIEHCASMQTLTFRLRIASHAGTGCPRFAGGLEDICVRITLSHDSLLHVRFQRSWFLRGDECDARVRDTLTIISFILSLAAIGPRAAAGKDISCFSFPRPPSTWLVSLFERAGVVLLPREAEAAAAAASSDSFAGKQEEKQEEKQEDMAPEPPLALQPFASELSSSSLPPEFSLYVGALLHAGLEDPTSAAGVANAAVIRAVSSAAASGGTARSLSVFTIPERALQSAQCGGCLEQIDRAFGEIDYAAGVTHLSVYATSPCALEQVLSAHHLFALVPLLAMCGSVMASRCTVFIHGTPPAPACLLHSDANTLLWNSLLYGCGVVSSAEVSIDRYTI